MSFDVKEITNESIRLDTNNIINIKRIYIANYASYIISESYNLYVCGLNNVGQLGLGDTINRMKYELIESTKENDSELPIDINNNNVKEVIINNGSSYLITNDNNLYVCGSNGYGQ